MNTARAITNIIMHTTRAILNNIIINTTRSIINIIMDTRYIINNIKMQATRLIIIKLLGCHQTEKSNCLLPMLLTHAAVKWFIWSVWAVVMSITPHPLIHTDTTGTAGKFPGATGWRFGRNIQWQRTSSLLSLDNTKCIQMLSNYMRHLSTYRLWTPQCMRHLCTMYHLYHLCTMYHLSKRRVLHIKVTRLHNMFWICKFIHGPLLESSYVIVSVNSPAHRMLLQLGVL